MDNTLWAKLHGASVHFPIALILCSWALDALGLFPAVAAVKRGLHSAGYWTMLLGALGTVPAVVTGMLMTNGVLLGHDALRLHHLFAWPAFGMAVGLATWRALSSGAPGERPPLAYLAAVGLASALVLGAGYWGGEMILAHP